MAKKKRNNGKSGAGIGAWHQNLRPETKHSLWAVLSFLAAVLLALAYFGKAGLIGNAVQNTLRLVFGRGFFLVSLAFFLAGLSFLFALGNHLLITTILGGVLFLISSLGLADILFGFRTGGYVGFLFSYPFLKLFDFWASLIIFSALLLASLLIMLNVSLKPKRKEKKYGESEEKVFIPAPAISPPPPAKIQEKIAEGDDEEKNIFSAIGGSAFGGKKSYKPQKLELAKEYAAPPMDLLEDDKGTPSSGDIKANANIIKRTLQNFGIDVEMSEVNVGPSVTQYTLKPAEGVKLARITALHNDLALALAAHPLRIEAPIPSKSLVGIEVPNRSIALVGLRSLLGMDEFKNAMPLTFALGRDVSGKAVFADIAKMPHLLVAGATGSGKSITIHTLIVSLLYKNSPEFVRFLMIDPKRVELSIYKNLPHLLTPVIIDAKKAIMSLRWAVREMERRYEKLSEVNVRDIISYNTEMIKSRREVGTPIEASEETMPNLIIIIDELADLMASYPREMEASIVRLAQMSRAVGIHLVVSTQRPSVEVITGLIKANITSRIALQVASGVDSRTILDMSGAEKLLGNGDMLYLAGDTSKPKRIQAAFISEKEVKKVAAYVAESAGEFPSEEGEIDFELKLPLANGAGDLGENEDVDDELYEEAKRLIIDAQKASASYLQRRLRVGYARAARLLDMLEERGVIGPGEGAKPREVLIKKSAESIAIGKTLEPDDFKDEEEEIEEIKSEPKKELEIPYTSFDKF